MKHLARITLGFWLLCLAAAGFAQEPFAEGTDYRVLEQPGHVEDPSTIEVREFFWYGCPHCFQLEGALEAWRKNGMPEGTRFVRTPPALNEAWAPHSHAYFVAESMGKADEISVALFDAIHVKKQRLRTADELAAFFVPFGISEEEFHQKYNSFAVRTKVRAAMSQATAYRLRGVPCLIVNGKYFVDLSLAKNNQRMMEIVNYLIAKEKAIKAG